MCFCLQNFWKNFNCTTVVPISVIPCRFLTLLCNLTASEQYRIILKSSLLNTGNFKFVVSSIYAYAKQHQLFSKLFTGKDSWHVDCIIYWPQMVDCLDLPDLKPHCSWNSFSYLCFWENCLVLYCLTSTDWWWWTAAERVQNKTDARKSWTNDIALSLWDSNKARESVWDLCKHGNDMQDSKIQGLFLFSHVAIQCSVTLRAHLWPIYPSTIQRTSKSSWNQR